ncbi:MAG: MaoC/PaaZ C-terminal domain-containing protein [Christensenellales bacterium]|jgi:3-hydroxybutyryl-CoA dehydratase
MNEYTFEQIQVGHKEQFSRIITKDMEDAFREITGDNNPMHRDDNFAIEIGGGKYRGHVAFGMLTASLISTLGGMYLPGKYSLIHSVDKLSFRKPVYVGDVLTIAGEVKVKQDGLKLIIIGIKITNQNGKTVATAEMKNMVQR